VRHNQRIAWQARVHWRLFGNPSQSPPTIVAQTQPFSWQAFSVRKTPVFRTRGCVEKSCKLDLLVPGATGAIVEASRAIMANRSLFKRGDRIARALCGPRILTPF
jgi:hypothetical protein